MKTFIQAAAFHLHDDVLAMHIEAAARSVASVVAFFITFYLIGSEAYKTVAEATTEAFA